MIFNALLSSSKACCAFIISCSNSMTFLDNVSMPPFACSMSSSKLAMAFIAASFSTRASKTIVSFFLILSLMSFTSFFVSFTFFSASFNKFWRSLAKFLISASSFFCNASVSSFTRAISRTFRSHSSNSFVSFIRFSSN